MDYDSLRPGANIANLNNAFDVAEKQLGLPRLLDAEGVYVNLLLSFHPRETSIFDLREIPALCF